MKSQFLRIIENKLSMLEESNITDLMLKGDVREARAILEHIEYNSLTSYLKDRQFEKIKSWEIPKSYRITFIWYLWNSEHKAGEIIADVEEWEKDLLECAKIYKKEQRDVIRKILNEVI